MLTVSYEFVMKPEESAECHQTLSWAWDYLLCCMVVSANYHVCHKSVLVVSESSKMFELRVVRQ